MKNRIFFAVFLLLTHLGAWGQIGGDYNPSNPSDPGTPIQKYTLTLNATPSGGGSFNTTSTKVAVGESYNLRAYPNSDYNFVAWLCDGDTISKSASYNYVMPAHNVDITGVFVYNPNSPSDPEDQPLKYQLSLTASPMNSGSFNFSNERLAAGSVNSLHAYTNTDFVFKQWMMGDSVLSTSQNMDFVMPAHNVQIVGLFEYNPASPENPNKNYWNKETGEVIVDDFTPNSLYSAISNAIGGSSRDDVSMIIVAGKMGDNDFGIANNFSKCSLLDLSRTTGVTEIPSYAFDYTNLESVYLPATVEKIGYRAFADCSQLLSLTVYAMTPPVLDSYVFDGVQEGLVVYVPAGAIPQYQEAEGWKNFTLLPIQEDIRNLTVNLPAGTNVADYAQMWLELTNTKNGQRIHYVMTDKTAYTFMNIIRNTSWNITLCNQSGDVFGKIDNVEVKDEDVTVTFASLTQPKSVNLSVKTPDGQDVTQQTQITWTNAEGKYLSQGCSLTGLPVGYQTKYKVILSEQLAMLYNVPAEAEYTLTATDNNPVCQLTAIGQVKVSGKVVDKKTNQPVNGAVISASQTFGGKYSKTFSCKTDNKGEYSIDLYKVPSSIAFSAADHVSQTLGCDSIVDASGALAMQDVALKEIAGAVISLSLTYTPCAEDGETAEVQNWFNDYNNVGYTLYNKTKNRTISQFNVQYPQIVLLEEVADGDELLLTATSKTGAFMPVQENVVIAEQAAEATVNIIELGKIDAAFSKNINSSVKGILYDGNGKLVKSYDYAQASLSIGNLTDGSYTLVSMGDSKLFSSIYDLSQFSQAGLTEGTDYVKNTVAVQSGKISKISIEEIPTFNESKLYYTGENTSFTVNKSSIVAGNYLTLSGRIDFKPAYVSSVSNIQMVVDLPENCSFVENSVMVGNNTSSYTLNGNRLTIPVARLNDRIRFCVIPTLGGDYAPSAFAQFDMNGETITQPIGSANYTAKDLSIVVPSTVAKTTVPVSGTAIGKCDIEIYDNDMLVGQTTSLANGTWATSVELNEPYNLSKHQIYAKVTTANSLVLQSNLHECVYDKNTIEPKSVTMSFYNGWIRQNVNVVFDFVTKTTSTSSYMFYTKTNISFIADLGQNSPDIVSDVDLYVFTNKNEKRQISLVYDKASDKWVGVSEFSSDNLPVNLSISVNGVSPIQHDRTLMTETSMLWTNSRKAATEVLSEIEQEERYEVEQAQNIDEEIKRNEENVNALLIGFETGIDDGAVDEYYSQLGIDTSNLNVDIPNDADMDWLNEILEKGYSILSKTPESSISDEEFKTLLSQSETVLADGRGIDAKESFASILQNEIDVTDESGENVKFYQVNLSELSNDLVVGCDTTVISMTEGPSVLFLNNENDGITIIVDEYSGIATVIISKEVASSTKAVMFKARKKNDFVEAMREGATKANNLASSIISFVKGVVDDANKKVNNLKAVISSIELKRTEILGQRAGTSIQIQDVENQLRTLKNQKVVDIDEYQQVKNQIADLTKKRQNLIKEYERLDDMSKQFTKKLNKMRPVLTGTLAIIGQLNELREIACGFYDVVSHTVTAIKDHERWYSLINAIEPCKGDEAKASRLKQTSENEWSDLAWSKGYYPSIAFTTIATTINTVLFAKKELKWLIGFVGGVVTNFMNNTASVMFDNAINASSQWYPKRYKEYMSLKCEKRKEPKPTPPKKDWPRNNNGGNNDSDGNSTGGDFDPITPIHDPSGYVYEAVATNRLEGVTATCFYKETVEDMYGDLHENIVKWDAAEYAQENPLFTDENGMYAWDVPQGLWQVKFEKEGYETTYSEWLPVPPPQLDVNIAMKQNVQPVVKNARAFEDAVEVEFDKYMIPELLNTDNILVMADGKALEGKVELLNEEVSYEGNTDTYASKIRFNAVNPFPAKDVTLLVKNQVKSYAGIRMQEDYQQDFTVEQEVRKIACDSLATVIYGEAAEVTVSVLPAAASAGKTLNVKALSNIIISVDEQQLTLDEDGKASFLVKGELPGTSALTFSMDGYDVSATTIVSVETESSIVTAIPKASIASGSEVGKDTEVYLSCDTEGATIYYTLDGSCPCDETGSRKVYDGEPIIISQSVTIKAMAVVKGKTESDVAEFVYTVVGDGIDDVTVNGKIHIYPLPVRDKLNVVAGGKTIKSVTISSLNGVQVAESNTAATAVTLNVGNIAAGIYIVNVKTENGNYNRKIVKL